MRTYLASVLAALLVFFGPTPANAADTLIESVSTSTTSASSANFGCGVQLSVRCETADASYRACDMSDVATCTAVTTDMRLTQNVTYDIPVPSSSTSQGQCRIAFITASGTGTCRVYRVIPRTIPSNLQ